MCLGRADGPATVCSRWLAGRRRRTGVAALWLDSRVLSAIGPLRYSAERRAEYADAQAHPGQIQDGYVELSHRMIGVGRSLAIIELAVGGLLLATPLVFLPQVWKLWRLLNRQGVKMVIGGFADCAAGLLIWFGGALPRRDRVARPPAGRSDGTASYAGYVGIIAGTGVVAIGSIIAVRGKSKTVSRSE